MTASPGTPLQPEHTAKSTPPAAIHSSAAFLHHLHHAPSSHHITLASTSSNRTPGRGRSGQGQSDSPPSIAVPLEPTVIQQNKPPTPSSSLPPRSASVAPSSQLEEHSTAGRSSLRNPFKATSSRKRPSTAPSVNTEGIFTPSIMTPDSEIDPFHDGYESSSSTDDPLPHLLSEDVCTTALVDYYEEAKGSMACATSGEAPKGSVLVGHSGRLSDPASVDMTPQASTSGFSSPTEQLSWKTFSRSYAHGLFEPDRIPNAPRPGPSSDETTSVQSSPGSRYQSAPGSVSAAHARWVAAISHQTNGVSSSSSIPVTSTGSNLLAQTTATNLSSRMKALELENLDLKRTNLLKPDKLSLPSYSLAAATVRMASSSLRDSSDLAPLGVPSPERELMDPMMSMVSPNHEARNSPNSDPGSGTNRFKMGRSISSSQIPGHHTHKETYLPTIQASPLSTPSEGSHETRARSMAAHVPSQLPKPTLIPPQFLHAATAPVDKVVEKEVEGDYFGAAADSARSSATVVESTPVEERPFEPPSLAFPRDIGSLYEKLGWMPAPVPPGEAERRKALYRYGILHTAKDINFDRIAHMAKLVFNSRIVLISLTDIDSQWHKSQTGLGVDEAKRITSFCSHTILAKSDEPFVVLDTLQDWRFHNNPLVVGGPKIRFYAGAPLRTPDGYNIGSLCIIDNKPRAEFPPRQRLILKEFAGVTMREMELWRDKLQLRIRDKIQSSMEVFTRECLEMDATTATTASNADAAARMDQVYARAAQLVRSTLDLDGCFILDISQFEMTELETETGPQIVFRADPYISETQSPVLERSESFGPVDSFPVLATTPAKLPTRPITGAEHEKLSNFLRDHRDGRIFENVAPSWIRYMFPSSLRYGMVVPVYGVDQQPFAMICAYTSNKSKQFLEGYELQFLRAIGVIILSAVLRRRMLLADKTKSILISSVSHELRTPLHGILAAAELLGDTPLDPNQTAFLKTVETCGNSLIETVNHVLDFTKLSGSASQGGSSKPIKLDRVNLANLVESTVESCWIGQRARSFHGDAEIGSFYAPPAPSGLLPKSQRESLGAELQHVETVIDIGYREKGWNVRCERGGLRRVLMNLVGNSLKFTKDGYVQVTLRELPHSPGAKRIPVEMAVIDTGKGIGKSFLKEHLFRPFSQENPLQTGTGLGLAIVNTIVRSETVNGTVDVWSSEGMGTEIRVSFEVEVIDEEDESASSASSVFSLTSPMPGSGRSVSLLGFKTEHRGHMLALDVLSTYIVAVQFELKENGEGDILIINDDDTLLKKFKDTDKPVIFLTTGRRSVANVVKNFALNTGRSMQIMYKPVGPSALRGALSQAALWLDKRDGIEPDPSREDLLTPTSEERPIVLRLPSDTSSGSNESTSTVSELSHSKSIRSLKESSRPPRLRRRSEEHDAAARVSRPRMGPRMMTYHHAPSGPMREDLATHHPSNYSPLITSPQPGSPSSTISTISLADGSVMLKSAAVAVEGASSRRSARVLVVEDNVINRRVLEAFIRKRGMEYFEAVNGENGVAVFEQCPPKFFDVILMDISMPVMNGHEATRAIRRIEAARRNSTDVPVVPAPSVPIKIPPPKVVQARVKIFALTGLATSDDKREAFGSGVDGYLVKPVSLKSLGAIFQKIGFSVNTNANASTPNGNTANTTTSDTHTSPSTTPKE